MRQGFWPLDQSYEYPWSSRSFPSESTDFHCQEYIQFFDVSCCLFMPLHFTVGCDYRNRDSGKLYCFQFCGIQILPADHVSKRTGVLSFCLFLRPILKFWSVRDSLMRFTWANSVERWILVSTVGSAQYGFGGSNTSDWFRHGWALPSNRWRSRRVHILRYNPIVVSPPKMPLHVFCHSLWAFYLDVLQPDGVRKSTFPRICIPLLSCTTSTLVNATFQKIDSHKYLQHDPCMADEKFSQTDFYLLDRWISLSFSHLVGSSKVLEQELAVSQLLHAYCHRAGICLLSYTVSLSFVNATLFPLILDQSVWLNSLISSLQVPWSQILLNTSFYHCLQPKIIMFRLFFWWISQLYNSITVSSFSDPRILNLYRLSKMSSGGKCSIDNKNSTHLVPNSWMLSFRKQYRKGRHNPVRNHGRQWHGSNRKSSKRSAFREGIGRLSEPLVPPDWPFSWIRNSG